MGNQPQIHFIEADTYQEAEEKVNAWLAEQDFRCTILGVNPYPMMLRGKPVFLTVITYIGTPVKSERGEFGGMSHEDIFE